MRRFGGVPPIVTVLVVVASIVAASLVAWFLWTSTRAATQQPVLEVTSAYASCTGSTCAVSFTVRNVGAQQITSITLEEIICEVGSTLTSSTSGLSCFPSGQTASCRATFSLSSGATISDGASCTARLRVEPGGSRVALGFKVIRP
ncbi:MAG: hypothetical protein QXT37_09070 [Thermofilaceae archaeon]